MVCIFAQGGFRKGEGLGVRLDAGFRCCHGADDAYARIYGYFKRQLARVSVRAAMLVRLRALDVVLGRSPRPESSTDRKEAKRAKATRLAAVHVVSESGIPADRGSFGA